VVERQFVWIPFYNGYGVSGTLMEHLVLGCVCVGGGGRTSSKNLSRKNHAVPHCTPRGRLQG
jgi:hypothetical protein